MGRYHHTLHIARRGAFSTVQENQRVGQPANAYQCLRNKPLCYTSGKRGKYVSLATVIVAHFICYPPDAYVLSQLAIHQAWSVFM